MSSASGTTPVSFSCAETRDRFAAYLDERLVREDRQAVRGHLEDCASCRREASAKDPAFLFAFMDGAFMDGAFVSGGAGSGAGAGEVSPDETARILAAVRTGIELKKAERRVGTSGGFTRGGFRRALRIAASVAAAAFVAALAGSSGVFRAPKTVAVAAAVAAVAAGPASGSGPASESVPDVQQSPGTLAPAAVPESAGAVSPFAEARGPVRGQKLPADATIYDWNPGGGQPRVVWIVDRSLDI
jgi:Putative zinc-finger